MHKVKFLRDILIGIYSLFLSKKENAVVEVSQGKFTAYYEDIGTVKSACECVEDYGSDGKAMRLINWFQKKYLDKNIVTNITVETNVTTFCNILEFQREKHGIAYFENSDGPFSKIFNDVYCPNCIML